MPNRVLRDWTDSEKIDGLSWQAEVLFTRLMMKADDYGVYHSKPSLIKASLFPLRLDQVREADISRWMAECQKAGLIAFYESDNKPYLVILNFGQRMRNMKKRFPSPPDDIQQLAATRGDSRPETRNEKLETETRNEKSEKQTRSVKNYDLAYFKDQGRSWDLPDELYVALDKFLNYRSNHPDFGPIKSPDQVEGIIREFITRRILTEDAVKMIDRTISRGAKNIIYELEKQPNGNGDKTIRKGQPDIARADELADKILQEHFNGSDTGGNQF